MLEQGKKSRPDAYYGQLRAGLKERFQDFKQLSDLPSDKVVKTMPEEELLELAPAQAVLWLVSKDGADSRDLDACIEAYDDKTINIFHVLIALENKGYIQRVAPDQPVTLTNKGQKYLASRE